MSATDHLSPSQFQGLRGLVNFLRADTNLPATVTPTGSAPSVTRFTGYTPTAPRDKEF